MGWLQSYKLRGGFSSQGRLDLSRRMAVLTYVKNKLKQPMRHLHIYTCICGSNHLLSHLSLYLLCHSLIVVIVNTGVSGVSNDPLAVSYRPISQAAKS